MSSDSSLANHPLFAAGRSILGRAYETYDFLLEVHEWPVEHPSEPPPIGRRVSREFAFDPVTRRLLDELIADLAAGARTAELLGKLDRARSGTAGSLLAAEAEAGGHRQLIKGTPEPVDLLTRPGSPAHGHRRLGEMYAEHMDGNRAATHHLTEPDGAAAAALDNAVALLGEVIPTLASGVLAHVKVIAVVEGPEAFESASTREVPGVIFVSDHAFRSRVRLAEALLHESVHHRLYDLQLTRSIFAADYDTAAAGTVTPFWHPPGTRWPFDRALAAAHVYVHLTEWFMALSEHPAAADLGPGGAARSFATSAERATGLLNGLVPIARQHTGTMGRAFIDWLSWCLAKLTSSERPSVGAKL